MLGPERDTCPRCDTTIGANTVACPNCGMPRAEGREKKREQVRFALAAVASVGVLLLWQWLR